MKVEGFSKIRPPDIFNYQASPYRASIKKSILILYYETLAPGGKLISAVILYIHLSFQISRQQFALCPPFSGGYKKTCCLSDSSGDDFQALRVGTETVSPDHFPLVPCFAAAPAALMMKVHSAV